MKKFWIVILLITLLFGVGFIIFRFLTPDTPNPSVPYTAEKTQADASSSLNQSTSNIDIASHNITQKQTTKETKLASFSTPLSSAQNGRRNNIELTASILNGTIIEPGKTFSFNEIVGKPSSERGYEKADVFIDGEKTKAIGGRKLSGKHYDI